MKKDTWIIVPAYNEQQVIGNVLDHLLEVVHGFAEIVVVNDCSRDQTAAVVATRPVHLLHHPINLGQGAALQTGITFAVRRNARYLVTFDADGQHAPEYIPSLLAPLRTGECDICLGSRFLGIPAENIDHRKVLILKVATMLTSWLYGLKLTDTHNGFRAFTHRAAEKLRITHNGMAHASEILARIRECGLTVKEIPVKVRYTAYTKSKGQKISNSFNIIWEQCAGALSR